MPAASWNAVGRVYAPSRAFVRSRSILWAGRTSCLANVHERGRRESIPTRARVLSLYLTDLRAATDLREAALMARRAFLRGQLDAIATETPLTIPCHSDILYAFVTATDPADEAFRLDAIEAAVREWRRLSMRHPVPKTRKVAPPFRMRRIEATKESRDLVAGLNDEAVGRLLASIGG